MKISPEEVRHVADLARLEFTAEELDRFTSQLSSILEYVEKLGELELEDVPPMSHVQDVVNALRDDKVRPSFSREKALSNAPDRERGCFKVPKVIDT